MKSQFGKCENEVIKCWSQTIYQEFKTSLYAVGEAALVDKAPASEVGRGTAAAGALMKTREAAESPSAPATAPATDAGREDDEARMHDAARLRDEARLDGACYHVVGIWLRLRTL